MNVEYDSNIVCTYCFYDSTLRKYQPDVKIDLDDVSDFEDMSDLIYQSELVHAFMIEKYSEDIINRKIEQIYEIVKDNLYIKTFIKRVLEINTIPLTCLYKGFMFLFCYDYFFITHGCICDIIHNNGVITNKYQEMIQML